MTGEPQQEEAAADRKAGLQTVWSLLPYLWPRGELRIKIRVVGALTALVLAKLFNVYTPILFAQTVDILGQPLDTIAAIPVLLILSYGLARILNLGFGELQNALFARVGQRAIRAVGLQVFEHLHNLSLRFHLERRTGGLSRSIDRGTDAIESLLRFSLFSIVPTLLELALVAGILWAFFNVSFAAVTIVMVLGYIAFTFFVSEWRLKLRRAMNESDSIANTRAIDSLLNFETVKYFGNERHEARRYEESLRNYEEASVKSQTSLAMLNVGQAAIIAIGVTVALYLSAREIMAGRMSIGDFVLVQTYLLQLSQPLGIFGFVYRELRQAVIDMERMFELLRQKPEIADKETAPALAISGPEIVFDRVGFAYDARRPILWEVSFTVPPGRKVALVGPSGAGKSTIARLLYRFYDVSEGAIRIDGQDIRDISQESLRAAIGIVPQDTVLFNDTVRYNLDYGRPGAGLDAIRDAARIAQIDGFIEVLPDGYETMVGERGLKLSGGEKQRVAIARCVLKDPAILILDEATSALDSATERAIQEELNAVARGRTTLAIAHRLSTIADANEILVLEKGRIAERGGHETLLEAGGLYAGMWQRQHREGENNGTSSALSTAETA